MSEAFKHIIEFFKQKLSIWIALALSLLVLLLIPSSLAEQLKIVELRSKYGGYAACVLIITLSLIIVDLFSRLLVRVSEAKRLKGEKERAFEQEITQIAEKKRAELERVDALHRLSVAERQILCGYILTGEKTQNFSIQDGNVLGLCAKHVLYRASTIGNLYGRGFAFNIQDWAWDYLRQNPHLITEGVPTDSHGRVIGYQNPYNLFDF